MFGFTILPAPVFGLDGGALTHLVVIVLAIGLVPVLVASWLFELTPEGLARNNTVDHDSTCPPSAGRLNAGHHCDARNRRSPAVEIVLGRTRLG